MRVGVTGATGFLGSHITRTLADRGMDVVGVVRNPERGAWLADRGIELRRADLLDRESLVVAFTGLDAVVANASPSTTAPDDTTEAFVARDRQATENVVEAALAAGVPRVIHVSSVSVYRLRMPWRTVSVDEPRRTFGTKDLNNLFTRRGYADCKAASEEVVWAAIARGLQPTVLRPGPVYGSRDTKLTARWRRAMDHRIRWIPTVGIPHVHAGDVAAAVAGALENPASVGRAYNVAGAIPSLWSVARAARRAFGGGPWLVPIPIPLWIGWDDTTTQTELGVRYRSLDEGFTEAFSPG